MKKILWAVFAVVLMGNLAIGLSFWQSSRGQHASQVENTYMRNTDQFFMVDGARVRVRMEGPKDAPALILIHGFTYSLESWDAWAKALSGDYRVIRYDLLGHGLTGPDPQQRYAPTKRAQFFEKLMDALEVERAVLAGNSLGGMVAWHTAANAPERVAGLITISPGVYPFNGVGDQPAPVPPGVEVFMRTAPEAAVRAGLMLVYEDDSKITDAQIIRVRDLMRREGNGDAFVRHLEQFTLPNPDALLAQISAPTLILWGEDDAFIPAAHGAQMQQAITDAELKIYDGVGHVAHEEAPQISLSDARAFLAELNSW